ncbi:hypothetical protein MA16_Dca010153 [Dendrobium catenatum]|uniref:Uncharacterized protein n=1 Tax=Dendrobium catenatum TaxID=906689 RepID=A0A2I0X792_9ASPA|nr:hypothetical protein MA16_Dca010153 [Dendrobium catenatum]
MPDVIMPRDHAPVVIKLRIEIQKGWIMFIFPEVVLSMSINRDRMDDSSQLVAQAARKIPIIS